MDWSAMITVGRVVRPHGNRGHVVVAVDTDFAEERFEAGQAVHLLRDGQPAVLAVSSGRPQAGRWIVGFAGVESIDAAEELRGAELRIPPGDLKTLEAGRYYLHDLVGCEVRMPGGQRLGDVARVETATGVPLLVVAADAEEILVPFAGAICRRVDPGGRVIEIDPPEGLVELNRPAARR